MRQLITADKIAARVAELGAKITADYRDVGKDLVLVCVLKGSVIFLADLCRHIDLPLSMDAIGLIRSRARLEGLRRVWVSSPKGCKRPAQGNALGTGMTPSIKP